MEKSEKDFGLCPVCKRAKKILVYVLCVKVDVSLR